MPEADCVRLQTALPMMGCSARPWKGDPGLLPCPLKKGMLSAGTGCAEAHSFTELVSTVLLCAGTLLGNKWGRRDTALS